MRLLLLRILKSIIHLMLLLSYRSDMLSQNCCFENLLDKRSNHKFQ